MKPRAPVTTARRPAKAASKWGEVTGPIVRERGPWQPGYPLAVWTNEPGPGPFSWWRPRSGIWRIFPRGPWPYCARRAGSPAKTAGRRGGSRPGSGFRGRLVACHDHNEGRRAQSLVRRLEAGEDVALISDAGTPLLSDPGYRIVRAARLANLPVRAIPGPSAIPAALSVAGLPTDVFSFFGFPPARRGAKRRNFLLRAAAAPGSLVFFESAVRAARLLEELDTILGEREASLSREVTKIYEDHWFGSLSELRARAERAPLRGEVTLVVGPKRRRPAPA